MFTIIHKLEKIKIVEYFIERTKMRVILNGLKMVLRENWEVVLQKVYKVKANVKISVWINRPIGSQRSSWTASQKHLKKKFQ